MKLYKLLPIVFLGFLSIPSASAGQLLPNLYAREFCTLRALGVSKEEARNAAVASAYVSSLPDLPQITVGGSKTSSDVVQAVMAVSKRCPDLY